MDEHKTRVIFRKWRDGEVIALFPEIPADRFGYECMAYQHVGQHGGAGVTLSDITAPASPDEYRDLAKELAGIGYNLEIVKRFTSKMRCKRMAAA